MAVSFKLRSGVTYLDTAPRENVTDRRYA